VFTVDTADRYKFNSAGFRIDTEPVNNIYINKQQSVINGFFTRIALTEFNMPWDIPNVNDYNNTFTVGGLNTALNPTPIEVTVTVDTGFYDGTELAAELQTLLNAAMTSLGSDYPTSYIWTVTFNIGTGKFTVSVAVGATFKLVPKNNASNDDLLTMMGFGGLSVTADLVLPYRQFISSPATMLYTPYFDIVSNQLTKKQQVADSGTSFNTGRNLLARIYLTPNGVSTIDYTDNAQIGTKPFTIFREFIIPKQIYWDTKEFINVIDLSLIDYKGKVLYEEPNIAVGTTFRVGSGNANWQLTFQVSEV
jgi:hypothetical protein